MSKAGAITEMPPPEVKKRLQRLLVHGEISESSITAPLRQLLRQDAKWICQHEHTAALETINHAH